MKEGLQCYICKKKVSNGIVLLNQYICEKCEKEIVDTPIDQLKYRMYKNKIKNIWKQFLIEA